MLGVPAPEPLLGELSGGLADFDQVAIRIADVAPDLDRALLGRRQELGPARALGKCN